MNTPSILLLNFSHPLTDGQVSAIEALAGQRVERVVHVPAQFDDRAPYREQASALVAAVGLTPEQWQTAPLLINLPSHNVIAALALAELHGRTGYFPAVIRLRRVAGVTPLQFEVAELLDLQAVRDGARWTRSSEPGEG